VGSTKRRRVRQRRRRNRRRPNRPRLLTRKKTPWLTVKLCRSALTLSQSLGGDGWPRRPPGPNRPPCRLTAPRRSGFSTLPWSRVGRPLRLLAPAGTSGKQAVIAAANAAPRGWPTPRAPAGQTAERFFGLFSLRRELLTMASAGGAQIGVPRRRATTAIGPGGRVGAGPRCRSAAGPWGLPGAPSGLPPSGQATPITSPLWRAFKGARVSLR